MKNKLMFSAVALFFAILAVSAVASGKLVQKELLYDDIKITLDGEEIIPTDVNGNYVEPFIIEGTTYLPVRGIANSLGLGVDWDDETNTVLLTSNEEEQLPEESEKEEYVDVDAENNADSAESSEEQSEEPKDANAEVAVSYEDMEYQDFVDFIEKNGKDEGIGYTEISTCFSSDDPFEKNPISGKVGMSFFISTNSVSMKTLYAEYDDEKKSFKTVKLSISDHRNPIKDDNYKLEVSIDGNYVSCDGLLKADATGDRLRDSITVWKINQATIPGHHDDSKKDIYPADDVNEFVKDTVIHSMDIMEKYGDRIFEGSETDLTFSYFLTRE